MPLIGAAAAPPDASVTFDPSGSLEDCSERCHRWLIEDPARKVTLNVTLVGGKNRRVQYSAGWVQADTCPDGRIDIARRIAGLRSAFVHPLIRSGFCPFVVLNEVPNSAPYLASTNWDDVIFDTERSKLLKREEYARLVVPAVRALLASQEPDRRGVLYQFVRAAVPNADLLSAEIAVLLAEPDPSRVQSTMDGDSAPIKRILQMSDAATGNRNLVDALLDQLDANHGRASSPGYAALIDNLAGITSSVPTWGSPPVCTNVDRIARYLPWGRDEKRDTTFLATLSRCDTGSERLLLRSFADDRPTVAATGVRAWWAAVAGGRPAAKNVANDVIALVLDARIPDVAAAPVYSYSSLGASLVREGAAIEEVALGLSVLGLLPQTIEKLNSIGHRERANALFVGLERGIQRLLPR